MAWMDRFFLHVLFASAVWIKGHNAIHLDGSLYDGDVIYACAGANVTMPWRYVLNPGDVISDIEWYYRGDSEEVIGALVHGTLLVYPSFSNRISEISNAGIVLHDVISADSGNYTVSVVGADANGQHVKIQQSIVVQVADEQAMPDLEAGHLPVLVSPEAVMDNGTGQWAIQLQCGVNFTSTGQPPFSVEWITPEGAIRESSSQEGGFFNLRLISPILGGNYTCRVPPHQHVLHASCHGRPQSQLSAMASVHVDGLQARLTLLEKDSQQLARQNRDLEEKNRQLAGHLQELARQNRELLEGNRNLTDSLQQLSELGRWMTMVSGGDRADWNRTAQEILELPEQVQRLAGETRNLSSQTERLEMENERLLRRLNETDGRVEKLTENTQKRVSFHARYLQNTSVPAGSALVVSTVVFNQGQSYDNSSGLFIAPYPGTYFFVGKTTAILTHRAADIALCVDQMSVDQGDSEHRSLHHQDKSLGVVQGSVHLSPGQTVWIRAGGTRYSSTDTSFSGFLVSLDQA